MLVSHVGTEYLLVSKSIGLLSSAVIKSTINKKMTVVEIITVDNLGFSGSLS